MFAEDFENAGETPIFLENYVGAPPLDATYTADPPWLDHGQCNGIILDQTGADQPDCPAVLKNMASALGQVGGTNPPTNHVVAAYTNWVPPGADRVEFRTERPIPTTSRNRYITFAVDVAAVNCGQAVPPLLKFYLTGNGADIPTFTTPINPGVDPDSSPSRSKRVEGRGVRQQQGRTVQRQPVRASRWSMGRANGSAMTMHSTTSGSWMRLRNWTRRSSCHRGQGWHLDAHHDGDEHQ